MDTPINVLVVDDAVVVRRMVADLLGAEPDIRVVGTAANGRIALQKLTQLQPDIVTLDVEMPELDGIATLKELRKTHPRLPVIMFSTLTERGTATTIDALSLGASDYVTKPANVGSVATAQQRIREELVPKIRALCRRASLGGSASPVASPPVAPARQVVIPAGVSRTVPGIVAIGVSTGGPNALAALLPGLPSGFPVPIVIVQHMPPMFTRLLAERLDAQCANTVVEATEGQVLQPGTVYIAPGDHHLIVQRRGTRVVTALNQDPHENSCRPAVDVLFRSVAAAYGPAVLGVVLTGMGQDGLRGSEDIKRLGGRILAQDEATSVVWGMPGFVAQAGLAERVLPLDQMSSEITRRVSAAQTPARAVPA